MADTGKPDDWGLGEWSGTGVGTNAGVTVTHTLTAGAQKAVVESIEVSGDAAALVTIESPAGTPIWRERYNAAFSTGTIPFPNGLRGAAGQNVLVKISASTSNCEANFQGYDEGSTS